MAKKKEEVLTDDKSEKSSSGKVAATATSKGMVIELSEIEDMILAYARLIVKTKPEYDKFKKGRISDKTIAEMDKKLNACKVAYEEIKEQKGKKSVHKDVQDVYDKATDDLKTMVDDYLKIQIKHKIDNEPKKKKINSTEIQKTKFTPKQIVAVGLIAATLIGGSISAHFISSNHHKKVEEKARIASMEEGIADKYNEVINAISAKSGVYIDEINDVETGENKVVIAGSCGDDVAVVDCECAEELVRALEVAQDELIESTNIETKTAFLDALKEAVGAATDVKATSFNKNSINTFDMSLSGKKVLDCALKQAHSSGDNEDVDNIVDAMNSSKNSSMVKCAYGMYNGNLVVVVNVDGHCVTLERATNGAAVNQEAVEQLIVETIIEGKAKMNIAGYNHSAGVAACRAINGEDLIKVTTDFVEESANSLYTYGLIK